MAQHINGQLPEDIGSKDFLLRRALIDLEENNIIGSLTIVASHAQSEDDNEMTDYALAVLRGPYYRKISLLDTIKKDINTAFEYYDKDRDNDPYAYDEDTENKILEIKLKIIEYLGKKLKTINIEDLLSKLSK
jgi:hypothetical protein